LGSTWPNGFIPAGRAGNPGGNTRAPAPPPTGAIAQRTSKMASTRGLFFRGLPTISILPRRRLCRRRPSSLQHSENKNIPFPTRSQGPWSRNQTRQSTTILALAGGSPPTHSGRPTLSRFSSIASPHRPFLPVFSSLSIASSPRSIASRITVDRDTRVAASGPCPSSFETNRSARSRSSGASRSVTDTRL